MQTTLISIFQLIKSKLHWLGSAIAFLAIFFVAQRLKNYWQVLDPNALNDKLILLVALMSVMYGLNNICLALAWKQILLGLQTTVSRRWIITVYGLSQIGKYIPGNIFHLAGRQALGMKAGLKAATLAKSSFWELALLAIAGFSFSALLLPLLYQYFSIYVAGVLFIAFVVCASLIIQKVLNPHYAKAFFLQLIFLSCSAVIFTLLVMSIRTQDSSIFTTPQFFYIAATYIVAWLVGLATPGAPAGIGVREVVILFFLKSLVLESDLLLAVLLGRIVSVLGDIFYFLFSLFYKNIKHI